MTILSQAEQIRDEVLPKANTPERVGDCLVDIANAIGVLNATVAKQVIQLAASDESTALTTGAAKVSFRMPAAFTLSSVKASLVTAQASGTIFTVNIKKNGTTIFSTKITIDNAALTSVGATTPAVLSTTAFADDDLITVDIDQIGDGTAKGLKISMIGIWA